MDASVLNALPSGHHDPEIGRIPEDISHIEDAGVARQPLELGGSGTGLDDCGGDLIGIADGEVMFALPDDPNLVG